MWRKIMFWFSPYKKQVLAFFEWASGIVNPNDRIFVDLRGCSGFFYFEFPLRYGDKPKKLKKVPDSNEIAFILRIPEKGEPRDPWIRIFHTPELEILENKNRNIEIQPLRWGLNEEEKKKCLGVAREVLGKSLVGEPVVFLDYLAKLPSRLRAKNSVGIALWREGWLRGSMVVVDEHAGEALIRAA